MVFYAELSWDNKKKKDKKKKKAEITEIPWYYMKQWFSAQFDLMPPFYNNFL